MKLVLTVLGLVLCAYSAEAHLPSSLAKLVGVYVSRGQKFVVVQDGHTLALITSADLTGNPSCKTRVGKATGQNSSESPYEAANVYFQLSKGQCPGIDGRVELHYNRALTGQPVYLIDVLLHRNTIPMNPLNSSNEKSIRWSLKKIR